MPASTPTIGITTYADEKTDEFHLPRAYVYAVRQAGGLPILLTPGEARLDSVLQLVDGLIFAGGGDIGPDLYDGASHPTISGVNSSRDDFELHLAQKAVARTQPILGICRGLQLLNVALGGTLVPHLPDILGAKIEHRAKSAEFVEHSVKIVSGSRLAEMIGATDIKVQSKHHQALDKIPDVWHVAAHAPDGVVEGLEHRDHPWMISVLWHPEESLEDPDHRAIFKAFVDEAGKQQESSKKA